MSRFVRLAIDELKKTGLKTVSGPMGTSVDAAKAAHEAVVRAGGRRVITTLKIDDRRDKPATMETKMRALE